jgi:hypothetical protein
MFKDWNFPIFLLLLALFAGINLVVLNRNSLKKIKVGPYDTISTSTIQTPEARKFFTVCSN